MPRPLAVLAAAAPILALAAVAPAAPALAASTPARVQLPSPNTVGLTGDTIRPLDPAIAVPVRVYLKPQAGLAAAATAVSTPDNPAYRHYRTAAQVKQQYGTTAAESTAVHDWLTGLGITVTATNSHYLSATGTVAQLDTAFDTQLVEYDTTVTVFGDPFTQRAAGVMGGFSVPSTMAADVLSVTGIDQIDVYASEPTAAARRRPPRAASPTRPAQPGRLARPAESTAAADIPCSQYWGQHTATIPAAYGHTTAPTALCGYTPNQVRSAYGVTGNAPTGKGRTIAILLGGYMSEAESDADRFFTAHSLKGFAPGQYRQILSPDIDSSCEATGSTGDEFEATIDIEGAHVAAPDANLLFYGVDCSLNLNQILDFGLDGAQQIVDQHLADVVSGSWGIMAYFVSPAEMVPWDSMLQEGALEGIGFTFSSGDSGDEGNDASFNTFYDVHNAQFPAIDPWVTAAGGTTTAIGANGKVLADYPFGESADLADDAGTGYGEPLPGDFWDGSGGGVSSVYPEPAYQRGVVPDSLAGGHRVMPDVSADAGALLLIGLTSPSLTNGVYAEIAGGGGTSESAPLLAGLQADAGQAAGRPLGFLNPALYRLAGSAAVRDITAVDPADPPIQAGLNEYGEFDPGYLITVGEDGPPDAPGILTATSGYDDATGIGAPAPGFVSGLARS